MTESTAAESSDARLRFIVDSLAKGIVVPFLGAGVNCCGRPAKFLWQDGSPYLPQGGELSAYLADVANYPKTSQDERRNLSRVAQYFSTMVGVGRLQSELRTIFASEYQPTAVHRFFARLPKLLRDRNYPRFDSDRKGFELLIFTTNYDDLLERAFREEGVEFDLLIYKAPTNNRAWFLHVPPKGEPVHITEPNSYSAVSLDERPVIVKIHGAVDRANPKDDCYVITEDDYIDYLAGADLQDFLPAVINEELVNSHFLFMGYSLQDWNLRVFLKRIWDQQANRTFKSWAIQRNVEEIERELWRSRNVDIIDASLESCMDEMTNRADALPPLPARKVSDAR